MSRTGLWRHKKICNSNSENDYKKMYLKLLKEHNKLKKEITLVTDHFGQKQLYYYLDKKNNVRAISSEIKPLLEIFKVKKLNQQSVFDYIDSLEFDHDEKTFFENIKRLEPGHIMKINSITGEEIEKYDYRNFSLNKINQVKENNYLDLKFKSVINESLEGDFQHAISLSGGLDGLFLLNCISGLNKLDKIGCCYTVEFEDFSEVKYAKQIADYFGLRHKKVSFTKSDFIKSIQKNVISQEGPVGGLMNCGLFSLVEKVKRDGFKTILGGMGLDELFGGYDIFNRPEVNENVLNRKLIDGTEVVKDKRIKKYNKDIKKEKFYNKFGLRGELIFGSKLRRNLRMLDRLGMQSGIEFRSPFVDWDIFSVAMSYEENDLHIDGLGKKPIRDILNKYIDLKLTLLPKKSIQAPQRKWLCDKEFNKLILEIFEKEKFFNNFYLDKDFYSQIYSKNLKNNLVDFPIWQLINIYFLSLGLV